MKLGLDDKVVLVTGATANIGRAIVRAFAVEGARIVVSGRDAAAGSAVVIEARELGAAEVVWIEADLLDPDAVSRLAEQTLEKMGRLDVLVNNTGGNATVQPFAESDEESWRFDIDINLMSTLRVTRALLPAMIANGGGRIVNVASTAGLVGDPFLATYSAAKAAVIGFTKVLACEVGRHGITVNAIAPYATRPSNPAETRSTGSRGHAEQGLFNTLSPQQQAWLGAIYRKGVLPRTAARSDEIGAMAAFLASTQAEFMTGEVLAIDGGVHLAWRHPDTPGPS